MSDRAALARLGVFGGAFDPPHLAHVALAQGAVEQLQLDRLKIFPTGQAWHKARALSASQHRLALARTAFAPLPRVEVDDRELRRPGPTYTIDTLRELKAEHPAAQLFLLMGEDQAVSLTRWHEWEAIVQLAVICVAARSSTADEGGHKPGGLPAQAEFRLLRLPSMTESATQVRERIARGEGVAHLVPAGVASYIERHHLYRTV